MKIINFIIFLSSACAFSFHSKGKDNLLVTYKAAFHTYFKYESKLFASENPLVDNRRPPPIFGSDLIYPAKVVLNGLKGAQSCRAVYAVYSKDFKRGVDECQQSVSYSTPFRNLDNLKT